MEKYEEPIPLKKIYHGSENFYFRYTRVDDKNTTIRKTKNNFSFKKYVILPVQRFCIFYKYRNGLFFKLFYASNYLKSKHNISNEFFKLVNEIGCKKQITKDVYKELCDELEIFKEKIILSYGL